MTKKQAIEILKMYAPCPHDLYDEVGIGGYQGKCNDCGNYFSLERRADHKRSAQVFDKAIDVLLKEPPPRVSVVAIVH